jgi:uncharacterized heparinase superfamily protein
MMRVSVAERARLSVLIGRRAFRSLLGSINAHPLLRWRFASTKTDRLVIAPQDLRTADATRASEIYAGRFAFAGKVVICDRRSPFEMTPPSDEWAVTLLGFVWLRHLRAADSAITRANARSLIDEWINIQGGWHVTGWRADVLSRCDLLAQPSAFILQTLTRAFIDALSAACRGRCVICAARSMKRATACPACRRDRLGLRDALYAGPARYSAFQRTPADRRIAHANSAGWRPHQPKSRHAD